MTTIDPLTAKPTAEYADGKKPLIPEGMYQNMTISEVEAFEIDPENDKFGKIEKGYTHRVRVKFVDPKGEREFEHTMNWGPDVSGAKIAIWRLQKAVFGSDINDWGGLSALQGQQVHVTIEHSEFNGNPYVDPRFTPVG